MSSVDKKVSLGIDIGGSHLTAALVDNHTMQIIDGSQARMNYDHTSDAETIFNIWAETISTSLQAVAESAILSGAGFAMPGPFEYKNGISRMEQKMVSIFGKHIPTELSKILGRDLEMRFLNDATCFAIGESIKGEGTDKARLVVATLGTGFGSAFLDHGIPVVERADVPAEGCLWHLPFEDGIADDFFSTGWFTMYYETEFGEKVSGVKEFINKGDKEKLKQTFEQFSQNLANFLEPHLRAYDADILIVGGNISKALPYFQSRVMELLKAKKVTIDIRPSILLEDAAIIGAAKLMDDEYWTEVYKTIPKF